MMAHQGSRGRRIRHPGMQKKSTGRIKMLRPESMDAHFFPRGTTENYD